MSAVELDTSIHTEGTSERRYPRFRLRLQAAVLDAVFLAILFILTAVLIGQFDLPSAARIALVAVIVLGFEPVLVSRTGSTVGHFLRGLKVEDAKSGRKLGLFRSSVRFVVKGVLGLYSLISILITRRYQAVHDAATASVVVLRHPDRHAPVDQLLERDPKDPKYDYPSRIRRAAVVVLYIIFLLVLYVVVENIFFYAFGIGFSAACIDRNFCSAMERFFLLGWGTVFFAGVCWLVWLGATGRLWGARRRERSDWADTGKEQSPT